MRTVHSERDTGQRRIKMEVTKFLVLELQNVHINVKESEMELFDKNFRSTYRNLIKKYITDGKERGKDLELSVFVRQEGNVCFKNGNYELAIVLYFKSIGFAPYDSVEHAVSLANRSAVLFATKRYEDCLVDIKRVLVSNYPKVLMNKILIRQAKCLLELKRFEAAAGVVDAFKLWLENEKINITQEKIDISLKRMNDIEKLISGNLKAVDSSEQIFPAPSFIDGENPHFAYASKAVDFAKNERQGRHVIAKSNIKKGDILFIEEPYSTSYTSSNSGYYLYCNQCFACVLTCITCKFCTEICFCSEQCRELFWNTRHKWDCVAIRKSLLCSEYSLALAMLFRVSQTGFNSTVLQQDVYGNKEDNYAYVNQLATHIADMPLEKLSLSIKAAVFLVTYLIHSTDYFDWLYRQDNRPEGSLEELYKIVGGFLLKALLQIDPNSEAMLYSFVYLENKFLPGLVYHNVALALYVSSSLMNHSCVPNAVRSFHGSTKIVKALTDIQKGNEITICYLIDSDILRPDLRQRDLMQNFYFKCTCRICSYDDALYAWLCDQCQGQALTTSCGRRVKCVECQQVSALRKYEIIEENANVRLHTALSSHSPKAGSLTLGLKMLQRIYFRDNYKFMQWYSKIVEHYEKIGDFRESLKYSESIYRIQQAVFGENAVIGNLNFYLRLCIGRVNYCLSLYNQTSANYKKAFEEATNSINHCADLLSYHMCPKLVDYFKTNMLQILSAGNLDYDKKSVSFHFNNIPCKDETQLVP